MTAVWELGTADAKKVSAFLQRRQGRTYPPKTAGIFLARLAEKGFLHRAATAQARPGRPAHVYSPSVDRTEAFRRQIQKFLADYPG